MTSGSGNTGVILGASSTTTGIALLPNTGGQSWVFFTSLAILAAGVTLLAFRAYAAYIARRG